MLPNVNSNSASPSPKQSCLYVPSDHPSERWGSTLRLVTTRSILASQNWRMLSRCLKSLFGANCCLCQLGRFAVQNSGSSHSMKIDNSSIERVEEFKYLGTTLTDQNCIQAKIKSRSTLGNACYYSVQNLLSSRSLSKNL
jgi:hypothetical protein